VHRKAAEQTVTEMWGEGEPAMTQYRKKPVVIEAVQYEHKGNLHPRYEGHVPEWVWQAFEDRILQTTNGMDPLTIVTLEGDLIVSPGDWIIKGVQGELYPCKPAIFKATYDPIET